MLPNSLELAAQAEAHAEQAYEQARQEVEAATAKLAECKRLFTDDPSKHRRSSMREAQEDLERFVELAGRAERELQTRREARAQAERKDKEDRLLVHEKGLDSWPAEVDAIAARLVELDRQLDAIILELASVTSAGSADYEAAAALSSELGRARAFGQRFIEPRLANARLRLQRKLAEVRAAEERDDLSAFMKSADTDWKTADLSGEQLEAQQGRVAALRQQEVIQGAVVAGARAAQAQKEANNGQ